MIKVALVDDHAVTRSGIKTIIEIDPAIEVVMEASDGDEFLRKLKGRPEQPDVAVLDISMPKLNGMETMEQLAASYPSIHILVFSFINAEDSVINMLNLGACGFIHKSADPSILSRAIRDVHENGFFAGGLMKKEYLKKDRTGKNKHGFAGKYFLTERELQFIRLASGPLSYKEIAALMGITIKTLENHRDSLFLKLDINNRAALTLYAIKNGIVAIESE